MSQRCIIERLGAKGDGVAFRAEGPVHVPFTLPGEEVEIELAPDKNSDRATLITVLRQSPQRIAPVCPLFTRCGGCAMQHLEETAYREWKYSLVETPLRRAGLAAEISPLIDGHGDGRRRVTFHARHGDGGIHIGFMAARSHDLVGVPHCPVLTTSLNDAAIIAKRLAEVLAPARKPLDIVVTASQSGFDIDIRGHGSPNDRVRAALIHLAGTLDLARLSLHGDTIIERRQPIIAMGRARVVPPPGAFLQATALSEELLAQAALAAIEGRKRVADLFCGCGPFALRIAEQAEVRAVEGDASMLAALDKAARFTERLRKVTVERRDLFKRPLLAPELEAFDAVVMDPPRAGAEAQAKMLAQTSVPVVVGISCDAATFARDAAILAGGGYTLERVQPVDQFKYSAHVEIVGIFRKPERKRARR